MKSDFICIAGPCAIESEELVDRIAAEVAAIRDSFAVDIIFKASFDKANRTSIRSFRGVGMNRGLEILAKVKSKYSLRILTDIHESWQAEPVSQVADVIQIPAFLCRQTDLIVSAAKTGKIVNIKKGQFLSGEDMQYPIEKARVSGATDVWATERGNMYGYNDLIVDFRNIPIMKKYADKVIMDCTHSVQTLGGEGNHSGGHKEYIPSMALAAKAFGADGYYFEVHPNPEQALSDSSTMTNIPNFVEILETLCAKN